MGFYNKYFGKGSLYMNHIVKLTTLLHESVLGQTSSQHSFNTLNLKTLRNREIGSVVQYLFLVLFPLVIHSQTHHLHFSQLWGTLRMSLRLPKFQEVTPNQIKLLPLRRKPNHKNTHKPQYRYVHIHTL